jgi:hypothetical protein
MYLVQFSTSRQQLQRHCHPSIAEPQSLAPTLSFHLQVDQARLMSDIAIEPRYLRLLRPRQYFAQIQRGCPYAYKMKFEELKLRLQSATRRQLSAVKNLLIPAAAKTFSDSHPSLMCLE